jgi:rhodanese-related sulfurtransferase
MPEKSAVRSIEREELQAKIEQGDNIVVVEALPPNYYDEGHLPGALNMPHDQVDELAARLIPDKDVEVVVYCANLECQNSVAASQRLAELGYSAVREYEGGKKDWIEGGLPVEKGPARQTV